MNKMESRNISQEQSQVLEHEDGSNNEERKDGTLVNNEIDVDIAWLRDGFMDDQLEEEYWIELANTSWCPVYVDPPSARNSSIQSKVQ
jgi:hypothetical protein